ncbi:MAG TPA: DUF3536 domain-containing protein [Dissulfurispiraceae bacterium]|nr:DUF3536 domain-containing protein [Dissulfurispiraceae bacterium]
MERYICIHGHFYQPPRENPWLEAVEVQDSAHPYHDWNERINAECYAPNSAARIIGQNGRIRDIVSNYSKISFNFGPTLLSWLEAFSPDVYGAILDADRVSAGQRSSHGNALAQAYSHLIMPLANRRDKRTQIRWGIWDFRHRFSRDPEGMWLPETAVDLETLDILAEEGIIFTVLAPRQASATRRMGTGKWRDVNGGKVDPARPYVCRLPSGRRITIFFYDGPISQAVAFENILARGEDFASRLLSGFSESRNWDQILSIATDGETYGHHHKFGDMALAYALHHIESNNLARLTNFGEYLDRNPPTHEVRIIENSSWSCIHGIERWRGDCGCNTGGRPGWKQHWRAPLREALDWLRDQLSFRFEHKAKEYLKDPWQCRDDYIEVILNRSPDNIESFLRKQSARNLSDAEKRTVIKLMELQRHAMLMFTSCGWFFDDISGLEAVQVLQYAGRAIQLADEMLGHGLEGAFQARLSRARSNVPEHQDGAYIFTRFVKPAEIDLKKVGAHYAVSSIMEDYVEDSEIYCYLTKKEDYQRVEAGRTRLAMGRISVRSDITWDSETLTFCILQADDHSFNGGVRTFQGEDSYSAMKQEMLRSFDEGDLAGVVGLLDRHFGMHHYSLKDLFKDQKRRILNLLTSRTLEEVVGTHRSIFTNNSALMGSLREEGIPLHRAFLASAEFTLNFELAKSFTDESPDPDRIQHLLAELKRWDLPIDEVNVEFAARHKAEDLMNVLRQHPFDLNLLIETQRTVESLRALPFEMNYWHMENVYFKIARSGYAEALERSRTGDGEARRWLAVFSYLGDLLLFDTSVVLSETGGVCT